MRTVWKYPLRLAGGNQRVLMPEGARIIAVHHQGGDPTMWAELTDSQVRVERTFRLHGTGHTDIGDNEEHRGTTFIDGYVWHVYEVLA